MLRHLNINNFAIIESLELDLSTGFTAITGETGAGKSILVDALGLLVGARADKDWVRTGAQRAELTAEFDHQGTASICAWLEQQELDEGDSCLLRRTLSADGGSRAYINGKPVALGQLQSLGTRLLEIHGQHGHQQLLHGAEQLRLLDAWAGHTGVLAKVAAAFDQWAGVKQQLDELDQLPQADQQFLELLQYQIDELEQHALPADEFLQLEQDHRRLSHSGELITALDVALGALQEDDVNAAGLLSAAQQEISRMTELDPGLVEAAEMLQVALVNVQEARATLNLARQRVDLDPANLEHMERQLGVLHDLGRKHRVAPEQLSGHTGQLAKRLEQLTRADTLRGELNEALQEAETAYREAASALSSLRLGAAKKLAAEVSRVLGSLAMPRAGFSIDIQFDAAATPRRNGLDRCEFQLAANAGQASKPLKKIASGGELSRVSLAIKAVVSGDHKVETLIFDEVDAGIGGETANTVGALLAKLAPAGQALCVTHLAQVAACADHQFTVHKQPAGNSTQVVVTALSGAERVGELARMLSGEQSEESLAHARRLLELAHN